LCIAINSTLIIIGLFGETFAGELLLDDIGDGRVVLVLHQRWDEQIEPALTPDRSARTWLAGDLGKPA
jgi:hypothetical protein